MEVFCLFVLIASIMLLIETQCFHFLFAWGTPIDDFFNLSHRGEVGLILMGSAYVLVPLVFWISVLLFLTKDLPDGEP
jgi:hypothetical protein